MRETLSPFVPFGGEGGNSFISLYFEKQTGNSLFSTQDSTFLDQNFKKCWDQLQFVQTVKGQKKKMLF